MEYLYDDICLIRDDMRDINSGGGGLDGEGQIPYSLVRKAGKQEAQTVIHLSYNSQRNKSSCQLK